MESRKFNLPLIVGRNAYPDSFTPRKANASQSPLRSFDFPAKKRDATPEFRIDGASMPVQKQPTHRPLRLPVIQPGNRQVAGREFTLNHNTPRQGIGARTRIGQYLQKQALKNQRTLMVAQQDRERPSAASIEETIVPGSTVPDDASEERLREHYLLASSKYRLVRQDHTVFAVLCDGEQIPLWKSEKGVQDVERNIGKPLGKGFNGMVIQKTPGKALKISNHVSQIRSDFHYRLLNEKILDSVSKMRDIEKQEQVDILRHINIGLWNVKRHDRGHVAVVLPVVPTVGNGNPFLNSPEKLDRFITAIYHLNQHGLAHNDLAIGPNFINTGNVLETEDELVAVDTAIDFTNNKFIKFFPNPFFQWVCIAPQNWRNPNLLPYWQSDTQIPLDLETLKALVLKPPHPEHPIYIPDAIRKRWGPAFAATSHAPSTKDLHAT